MNNLSLLGFSLELLSVLLSVFLMVISSRAYLRTNANSFGFAALGFGIVGVGLLSESVLVHGYSISMTEAHVAESTLLLIGMGLLYFSIVGGGAD